MPTMTTLCAYSRHSMRLFAPLAAAAAKGSITTSLQHRVTPQRGAHPSYIHMRPLSILCTHRISNLSESRQLALQHPPLRQHPQVRHFQSEAEFHTIADATLHTIQDTLDTLVEDYAQILQDAEVTLANGVLTWHCPPHGTWVLNKQTPNQQLWWSSPISGPKRFEYMDGLWCATQQGLALGPLLIQEIRYCYPSIPHVDMDI
jgi:frataxin